MLPRRGYKAAAYSTFGVGAAELQGGDKIIINQIEVSATVAFVPILTTFITYICIISKGAYSIFITFTLSKYCHRLNDA